MAQKGENGHHDLMSQMQGMEGNNSREDDFLAGVDAVAAGQEAPADPAIPVGQRIRQFREGKGLSLEDLAQRTGLPVEMLSEVENETASPPLGVLVKLGKALDMRWGALISGGGDRSYTVVRTADRQKMSRQASQKGTTYGYTYETLAPHKTNRSMEPFIVTLQPTGGEAAPSSHDGQEFIYVLDGVMEALVDDAVEILSPGDSIYYDSTVPHLLRPHGAHPVQILAVIYSPDK